MEFKQCTLFVLAIISVAAAEPEYHRVEAHYGEDVTAFQDILIDEDKQYVVVTLSKVSSRKVTPSINLHDFSVGYSAIKDVEHGTCYIEKSRHTLSQMKSELDKAVMDDGYYEVRQSFTCTSKTFVEREQMSTYGERIAAFCADYESVFTERVYTKRNKRSLKMVADFDIGCFICFGNCS